MKLRDMKKFVVKSLYLLLAGSVMLSMQSCTKDVDTSNKQIGFSVGIETIDGVQQSAPTRAGALVSKTQFANADKIGVWVVPFAYTSSDGLTDKQSTLRPVSNYVDNVVHTFNGTSFIPSQVIYYPSDVTKVDLYSVYPYDAKMSAKVDNSMTDPTAFSFAISADQSINSGAEIIKSDFMSAYFKGAKQGTDGKLVFRHRMSRVVVLFNLMEKYKGYTVNGVKSVKVCGVPLKSTINIADTSKSPAIVATSNDPVEILAYKAVTPNGKIDGAYQYEAIVTPGTAIAANAVMVKILLDVQGLGDVEFHSKAPKAITFAHKTQTNINVSLADEVGITFANVTIQGWGAPIVESGVTTKLSNMYINCVAEPGAAINNTGVSASLLIQGEQFKATAKYDAVNSRYHLQYDHGVNFGGYLESIEVKNASNSAIIAVTATKPLQIKGNPTLDSYSTVIGKLIFKANGTVELTNL